MKAFDKLKMIIVILMLSLVTVIHHLPITGFFGTHIFHRELFFFPIVLAGIWFGLKAALLTSIAASILYAQFFTHSIDLHSTSAALVVLQVLGFNLMALLTGWMVDRQRRQRRERDFLNETFGKYVSKQVRDEILAGRISLKGEIKEVTVLFADLRDFTSLVENIPPREMVTIINTYFEAMSAAITKHKGLVLQFIGDEIEAVFGAPIAMDNHQENAISAAIEMRERLSRVNLTLSKQGYPSLCHGIGLHTGKVVAANIGSPHRLSYALVGETVNIASRIQDLNKEFETDILLSDAVYKALDQKITMHPLKPVFVKGIRDPLQLYSIDKQHHLSF
ncbi:MAG: adenylate/guanylate cyclase domain-containing protein [Desulfosarcina sp.]